MQTYIVIQSKEKAGEKSPQLKKVLANYGIVIEDDFFHESPSFTSAVVDAGSILLQGGANVLLLLNPSENFEYAQEMLEEGVRNVSQRFLVYHNNFECGDCFTKVANFLNPDIKTKQEYKDFFHTIKTIKTLQSLHDEHNKFQNSFYALFGEYPSKQSSLLDSCFELCLEIISRYVLDDSIIHPSIGTELQWFVFEADFGRNKYNRVEVGGKEIMLDTVEKFVQYMWDGKQKKSQAPCK